MLVWVGIGIDEVGRRRVEVEGEEGEDWIAAAAAAC